MSRIFKNTLKLRNKSFGNERRENINKEILHNSTPLPKTIDYEDIDKEFNRWVKEDLFISYDGKEIPTFVLFSNQRFSEFLQSWDEVDENKNLIVNFKTITRENNPKLGTIFGDVKNIPNNHLILLKRVEAYDKSNRRYFIDYKIKQPTPIDFNYTVSIVTNKYELLNEFNKIINEKFNSITCYIKPNNHFIPMNLNEISDESEYNIDNRTYYAQNYDITVKGYIITEENFVIEEIPELKFVGFDGEKRKSSYADIEEIPCHMKDNSPKFDFQPVNLNIHFDKCDLKYKFIIDIPFRVKSIDIENIRSFKLTINDKEVELNEGLIFNENDEIKFSKLIRYKNFEDSNILIKGENFKNPLKIEDITEIKEIIIS